MKLISKLSIASGIIALAMVPIAYAVDVTQLYVTPTSMLGWADVSVNGGSVSYSDGTPAGFSAGSLELKTNGYFTAISGYMRADFMSLADVTKASYWTKQIAARDLTQTANLIIDADLNGDGTTDTTLIYKPSLQVGGIPVENGVWQYWDATNGLFLSTQGFGSGESALASDGSYTLNQIKAWYPFARINVMGVTIGQNLPYATVNIDGVTIGSTTYDFEKEAPVADDVISVPKTIQDCKKYGWETLFTIEGEDFRNQGQCVSYIVSSKAKTK